MLFRRTAAIFFVLMLSSAAAWSQLQGPKVVAGEGYISTSALRAGSDFRLVVVLDIDKDYHIGAAVPSATWPSTLDLSPIDGITFSDPVYPREKMAAFDFADGEKLPVYDGRVTIFVDGKVSDNAKPGETKIVATFRYQACNDTTCLPPASVTVAVPTRIVPSTEQVTEINLDIFAAKTAPPGDSDQISGYFGRGMILGFLALFGMGLLLAFTPCVYPMIPVTIGFFGMQTERRTSKLAFLAAMYVLGLAITYSALGVAAASTGGLFGDVLQNPLVPVVVAAVLVTLALSMFGLYELRVPSSIAARSQGRQGPIGALLMGLLFGIVAAPCVGPVTVSLLVFVANTGKPVLGFFTFFTLALGLGTPLFVLALFSGAINKLPQAGMWMVSVRKVFGLLLMGAAIYYLKPVLSAYISQGVADRALPLFIMTSGLYIGWLEPGLRKMPNLKTFRKMSGVALLVVGLSMTSGLSHKPVPMTFEPYSDAAVAKAAEDGKPIMIDFTADWCAACGELEHKTFPDASVKAEGKRFVRLQADHTRQSSPDVTARQKKYAVQGLPTIIFIDSKGKEVTDARIVGFVSPKQLLAKMKSVK